MTNKSWNCTKKHEITFPQTYKTVNPPKNWFSTITNLRTLKNVLVEILMGYLLSLMENIELKQMIHIYLY